MENGLGNIPAIWIIITMERLIGTYIFDPEMTAGKMIFLTGPRQVGKTSYAQKWLGSAGSEDTYFNWDDPSLMAEYKKNPLYFRKIIDEKFKGIPIPFPTSFFLWDWQKLWLIFLISSMTEIFLPMATFLQNMREKPKYRGQMRLLKTS